MIRKSELDKFKLLTDYEFEKYEALLSRVSKLVLKAIAALLGIAIIYKIV